MSGAIDTEDAKRRPHDIIVELNLREQVLNGVLVALTPMDKSKGICTFALSHWVELKKKDSVEI